jgi:hypothetical protein
LSSTLNNLLPLKPGEQQALLSLMVQSADSTVTDTVDSVSPKQKLDLLCNAIVDAVLLQAQKKTQLVVIEDLHWIDPTSEMLLENLLQRKQAANLFLLLTSRPEKLDYVNNANINLIQLQRLTHGETMQLAMSEMHGHVSDTVEEIVRWADGIPLFVEEIVKSSITSNEAVAVTESPLSPNNEFRPAVPNSLQDPLLATQNNWLRWLRLLVANSTLKHWGCCKPPITSRLTGNGYAITSTYSLTQAYW